MNEQEILQPHEDLADWPDNLAADCPAGILEGRASGLPHALLHLKIRLGVRRFPDGEERHFSAALGDSLLEVLRKAGDVLGAPILPPPSGEPLDALRHLERHQRWSEPFNDLGQPLWLALVHGSSRHFGVEYKLAVQVNTRWAIAPSQSATPRELLSTFDLDPAEFSLYYTTSSELLPPDTPLQIKRGDRFEAQKDGRYGAPASTAATVDRGIDDALQELQSEGYEVRQFIESGQRYVEVGALDVPSPPWSKQSARILVPIPETYPAGGLDAFYLEKCIAHQGGSLPYEQSQATIDSRNWALISWHYPVNRPWRPDRDDLVTHVFHCRGYFLRRGVVQ